MPFVLQLAILIRYWYNAPVMDDYDSILGSLVILADAPTFTEWLRSLIALHNEHRAATTRLVPQILVWITGSVDFRVLMLFGPLYMLGAFLLIWSEFREHVTPVIAGAAAFLVFQWSYSEALLHSSGALPHLGVVFFSIAGLYFALRPGWGSAVACGIFGVVAAFSQANGLLMLPIAAVGCFFGGRRMRAVGLALLAAAVWLLYFNGYVRPAAHPPMTVAFRDPLTTFRLFLINIGGVVPSLVLSQVGGLMLLVVAAWVTWKGLWRRHPTAFLWMAFVLISAATVTMGRAGWGLFRAERYAVYPALLMAILLFGVYVITKPWPRPLTRVAYALAAIFSIAATLVSIPKILDMSLKGHLLVDLGESGKPFGLGRFAGVVYPVQEHPVNVLQKAEKKDLYHAPRHDVQPTTVVTAPSKPPVTRRLGEVHVAAVEGATVIFQGWTDIPATVPARKMTIYPAEGITAAKVDRVQPREDAAAALRRGDALLSGFRLVVDYASAEAAQRGAKEACVAVEAPGREGAVLPQPGGGGCP